MSIQNDPRHFGLTGTKPDYTAAGIAICEQMAEEDRINSDVVPIKNNYHCEISQCEPICPTEPLRKTVAAAVGLVVFIAAACFLWRFVL
jgi:hypothetical protein